MKESRIFRILEFLALLILFLIIAEKISDYFIKNDYETKTSIITSGTINADILIQGPSRAAFGLNTKVLEMKLGIVSYNMGIDNSTIDEQLALLKLYVKNNKKPSCVFLEVTPLSIDSGSLVFHSYLFVPFLADTDIATIVKRQDPLLYKLKYIPFFKYSLYNSYLMREFISGMKQKIRGKHVENEGSYHGFKHESKEWDGKFDELKKENPNGIWFKVDSRKVQGYNEYMAFARENGIPLILYESPILKEALPLYKNHDSLVRVIRQMASNFNFPYISFVNLPLNSDKSNFYNSMHLKAAAVDRFTEIFCDSFSDKIKALVNLK